MGAFPVCRSLPPQILDYYELTVRVSAPWPAVRVWEPKVNSTFGSLWDYDHAFGYSLIDDA